MESEWSSTANDAASRTVVTATSQRPAAIPAKTQPGKSHIAHAASSALRPRAVTICTVAQVSCNLELAPYFHLLHKQQSLHATVLMLVAIDPALAEDGADPNSPHQIPPISQAVAQGPTMQTLQPQHPDQYRALPAPAQMYPPPYQPQQQMGYPPNQPAPRQRTAIACRYCRRRKVCDDRGRENYAQC